MARHNGPIPIVSHKHWVVVECGLVDHGSILGVGADYGHNYSKVPDREHYQHQLRCPGILEEGRESPGHLDLVQCVIFFKYCHLQ